MSRRLAVFLALTALLAIAGTFAVLIVSLGDCGLGPDARQSCYDGQVPWVWLTVAAFTALDLAAAVIIFRRPNRG